MEELDVTRLPRNISRTGFARRLWQITRLMKKCPEFLRAEHFSDPIHVKVFDVMARLIQGHVADVITLKNYFEQEGTLNDVGGIAYLINFPSPLLR